MLKMSLQRLPESHLASRPLEGVLGGADFMRIYAGLPIFAHLKDLSLKSSAQRGGPRGASQRDEPKEVSLERFAK